MSWLAVLLQAGLVGLMGPVLAGVVDLASARWRGASGPSLLQPWRDLRRLWRKGSVLPAGASVLLPAIPVVSLAAAVVAGLLVPGFTSGVATAPVADLLVILALLAVSRGAVALAGWDAGSALAAHAGGRAMAGWVGTVPVLLLVALALLLLSGSTNLDVVAVALRDGAAGPRLAGGLAAVALFGVALTEWRGGTEGWSGRHLATLLLARQLRFAVSLALPAALLPIGLASGVEGWAVGLAFWALKMLGLALLATALGTPRLALPVAAAAALIAVVVASTQGAA